MYLFFLCWTRQRGGERERVEGRKCVARTQHCKVSCGWWDELSCVWLFFVASVYSPQHRAQLHILILVREKKRYIKFSIQPQRWRRWLLLNNEKSEKFPMKSSHSPDFFLSTPYIFFLEIINNYITPRLLRLEFIYIFFCGVRVNVKHVEKKKLKLEWYGSLVHLILSQTNNAEQINFLPRHISFPVIYPPREETHLSLTICQKWFINFPPLLWWISSKATISCDEDVWDDDDEYYYYWSPVTSETVWYVTQHHLNLVCFFGCDSSLLQDTSSPPNFFFFIIISV